MNFFFSCVGGVALVYVGQPLDTIKVKMQTFPKLYASMIDCMRQTVVKEGFIRGLYAGTIPAIVANVAENSVLFAGYGMCQKLVANVSGVQVHNKNLIYEIVTYIFIHFKVCFILFVYI